MTNISAPTSAPVRRLRSADATAFHTIRLEGFRRHPLEFRIGVEDEADLTPSAVAERLEREYVVGGFRGGDLLGIAGLTRFTGAKLRHKALLWGMYIREQARGSGLADAIIEALLQEARREHIERVLLTVVDSNERARRVYARWGFEVYGVEPGAVREGDVYLDEALMGKTLNPNE